MTDIDKSEEFFTELMKESKDYQLQSLIDQFERFYKESATNTSAYILREALYYAKQECDNRGIKY